tara:strand:- start:190 stop:378 length:189 start_codon:yes stop_codon:yes gene_type:complete
MLEKNKMKVNDRVTKDVVMRVENPIGIIEKITKDYVVIKWENIPGHWHYTHEQSKNIEVINE